MELRLWSTAGSAVGAVVGTCLIYLAGFALIRLAGRRTTAQISAFDVLVTIALGSAVATAALPSEPSLLDGVLVVATFLALQVGVGAIRQRSPRVQRYTDFRSRVVVRNGTITTSSSPLAAQLTPADVQAALRQSRVASLDDVTVMILEPTGAFSVMTDRSPAHNLWNI